MGLLQRVRAAQAFDRSRFVPFIVDGAILGHVRTDLAVHLQQFAGILRAQAGAVGFRCSIDNREQRSAAMAEVARALAAQGRLSPWRDETYDIGRPGGESAFVLERAAVRFFGFAAQAAHVNGLVEDGRDTRMWIARRSSHKAIDPGMLDTLVGGGVATGLSVAVTVVKEAWEEAGIPQSLAREARATATLQVSREVPEGLHVETIHVFDLALPKDFVPVNQDGEVAEFRCLTLPDVRHELEGDAPYTVDAGLVAIDCLRRRGIVSAQ